MSNDALTTALKTDVSFREEFLAAKSLQEAADIAVRKGYVVTVADLEALAREASTPEEGELSEADLERVSGGRNQLFDMMNSIVGKFDESSKKVIQKLGQG